MNSPFPCKNAALHCRDCQTKKPLFQSGQRTFSSRKINIKTSTSIEFLCDLLNNTIAYLRTTMLPSGIHKPGHRLVPCLISKFVAVPRCAIMNGTHRQPWFGVTHFVLATFTILNEWMNEWMITLFIHGWKHHVRHKKCQRRHLNLKEHLIGKPRCIYEGMKWPKSQRIIITITLRIYSNKRRLMMNWQQLLLK